MGLMLGCAISSVKTAIELVPLAFVPQILFAGFFIKIDMIPESLRWIQYICALKWAVNIVWCNEFDNDTQKAYDASHHSYVTGASLLEANNIKRENIWIYCVVLCAIIVVARVIGMLVLSRKARTLYG